MPPRLSALGARLRPIRPQQRYNSSRPSHSHSQPSQPTPSQARITKLLNRLPRFLQPYTSGLRNAPFTHVSAFLILHEITAMVPLIILGMGFHYSGWLPGGLDEEKVLGYMNQFGSYFSKKGWFNVSAPLGCPSSSPSLEGIRGNEGEVVHKVLDHNEEDRIVEEGKYGSGTRVVLEVATAYAITKVLLPVRILGSVWATPWFARRVLGAFSRFRR